MRFLFDACRTRKEKKKKTLCELEYKKSIMFHLVFQYIPN